MRKLVKKLGVVTYGIVAVSIAILAALYHSILFTPEPVTDNEVSSVLRVSSNKVFEPVLPDNPVILPRDFGFHSNFQHGWLHFFANVTDKQGEKYGVQWSYFRIANDDRDLPGWLNSQLYIAHVAITHKDQVWSEQRISRGGIGQAGITTQPFKLWIDNWYWRSLGKTPFPGLLVAETDTFGIQLKSTAKGPLVIPGERGYVKKHDLLPVASHNILSPFISVRGELNLGPNNIVPVSGQGWLSKEWGSGLLAQGQQGWDWLVIHLDEETTLSISQYRQDEQLPFRFGTLATNDGKVVNLSHDQIIMEPIQQTVLANGKSVPLQWSVEVPQYGVNITTSVMNQNLWLPFIIPYWEGPIATKGTHEARGFMQLTGY